MLARHVMSAGRKFAIGRAAQHSLAPIDNNKIVAIGQSAGKLPDWLFGIERHPLLAQITRQRPPV